MAAVVAASRSNVINVREARALQGGKGIVRLAKAPSRGQCVGAHIRDHTHTHTRKVGKHLPRNNLNGHFNGSGLLGLPCGKWRRERGRRAVGFSSNESYGLRRRVVQRRGGWRILHVERDGVVCTHG